MAWAFPAALGAKLARPARQVVVPIGDGDFGMNAQEIETSVRENLPVIVVVYNDCSYGALRVFQENVYGGRQIGSDYGQTDLVKLAEAYGARGEKVEQPGRPRSGARTRGGGGRHQRDRRPYRRLGKPLPLGRMGRVPQVLRPLMLRPPVTAALADFVVGARFDDLPAAVPKGSGAHAGQLGGRVRRRRVARGAGDDLARGRPVLRPGRGHRSRKRPADRSAHRLPCSTGRAARCSISTTPISAP